MGKGGKDSAKKDAQKKKTGVKSGKPKNFLQKEKGKMCRRRGKVLHFGNQYGIIDAVFMMTAKSKKSKGEKS